MKRTWWYIGPGAMWKTLRLSQPGHHRISFVDGKIPTGLRTPQAISTTFLMSLTMMTDTQRYWVFDALMLSLAHNFLWIKEKALIAFRHNKGLLSHQCCKKLQCKSAQINHHLFSPPSPGREKILDRHPGRQVLELSMQLSAVQTPNPPSRASPALSPPCCSHNPPWWAAAKCQLNPSLTTETNCL